jgi:hypothetical protein
MKILRKDKMEINEAMPLGIPIVCRRVAIGFSR